MLVASFSRCLLLPYYEVEPDLIVMIPYGTIHVSCIAMASSPSSRPVPTVDIQRVYRGFKGRLRAKARKSLFKAELEREAAAMTIERVYRGHKVGDGDT